MVVNVLLPELLGKTVVNRAKQDPKIARRLIELLLLQNIGISEKHWREGEEGFSTSMRPPYEDWAKAKGGITKMLIEEPGEHSWAPLESVVQVES